MVEGLVMYELCRWCDHFIEPNDADGEDLAEYVHLASEDADNPASSPDGWHDAEPSNLTDTLDGWKVSRPDLFIEHNDGIGPNSLSHVMAVR